MIGARDQITEALTQWAGVNVRQGMRGEWSFRVWGEHFAHVHAEQKAHFIFPEPLYRDLRERDFIGMHDIYFNKIGGPCERLLDTQEDVDIAIRLYRLNYEMVCERFGLPLIPVENPAHRAVGPDERAPFPASFTDYASREAA
ncbi:MAG: DUF5519 family protein [Solirubrobacterales bacterium]